MADGGDARPSFTEIVRANHYMVLATADRSGRPWASPVWFATADCESFYWVSKPEARHSRNLAERPELALTIFDSRQPPGTGHGAYASAVGAPVPDAELEEGLQVYSDESVDDGMDRWSQAEVTAPARLRLYRAIALERFTLSSKDTRVPVDEQTPPVG